MHTGPLDEEMMLVQNSEDTTWTCMVEMLSLEGATDQDVIEKDKDKATQEVAQHVVCIERMALTRNSYMLS